MNDIDKIAFKDVMKKLFLSYGGAKSIQEKDDIYNLWCEDFSTYNLKDIERAIEVYRNNPDNKYFPKSPHIKSLIHNLSRENVDNKFSTEYNILKYISEREPCRSTWVHGVITCDKCFKLGCNATIDICMHEHLRYSKGLTEDMTFTQLYKINAERQYHKMFILFKVVWDAKNHHYIQANSQEQIDKQIQENREWLLTHDYSSQMKEELNKSLAVMEKRIFRELEEF
jgi:hypothetical protein